MKNYNVAAFVVGLLLLLGSSSATAQYDDLYYDPDRDAGYEDYSRDQSYTDNYDDEYADDDYNYDDDYYDDDFFIDDRPIYRPYRPYRPYFYRPRSSACIGGPNASFCITN